MRLLFLLVLIKLTSAKYWWENAVLYQIYPLSFKDSDNDGFGDLQGIIEKLDFIKSLGVDGIWLSPVFKSPMVDLGYDISSYYEVDSIFGSNKDLNALIDRCNKTGLRILLDFVPNHTSDEHMWWEKSVAKEEGYEDFYVWRDCNVDQNNTIINPINNWQSAFGGSAWSYNAQRQQCYLHNFHPKQPDLNYRNSEVAERMGEVLSYWLERGVDGFRVDAVAFLVENSDLKDDLKVDPNGPDVYENLQHLYTQSLPETYSLVQKWRKLLDENSQKNLVLVTESYDSVENVIKYYGNSTNPGASFSFNFLLLTQTTNQSTATNYKEIIDKWQSALPSHLTSNWVLGNHDNSRIATRYGKERIDGLNMLLMVLPGVAVTYNGEEIGMEDGYVSWQDTKDPKGKNAGSEHYKEMSRDFERTPYHWDDSMNAGFNFGVPTWLPVSELYKLNNAAAQERAAKSHLKVYRYMTGLRKYSGALRDGSLNVSVVDEDVLVVERKLDDTEAVFLVFNLHNNVRHFNITQMGYNKLLIVCVSVGSQRLNGSEIDGVTEVQPFEAFVLRSTNSSASSTILSFALVVIGIILVV